MLRPDVGAARVRKVVWSLSHQGPLLLHRPGKPDPLQRVWYQVLRQYSGLLCADIAGLRFRRMGFSLSLSEASDGTASLAQKDAARIDWLRKEALRNAPSHRHLTCWDATCKRKMCEPRCVRYQRHTGAVGVL